MLGNISNFCFIDDLEVKLVNWQIPVLRKQNCGEGRKTNLSSGFCSGLMMQWSLPFRLPQPHLRISELLYLLHLPLFSFLCTLSHCFSCAPHLFTDVPPPSRFKCRPTAPPSFSVSEPFSFSLLLLWLGALYPILFGSPPSLLRKAFPMWQITAILIPWKSLKEIPLSPRA